MANLNLGQDVAIKTDIGKMNMAANKVAKS